MLTTTIIIPTWKRPEWLRRCLTAIDRLSPAPDVVLVVGRAGDQPTQRVFDEWRHATALSTEWRAVGVPGHIPPIRLGVQTAETELVAILDDDAEPVPDWLGRLRPPFEDGRVACVGGQCADGQVDAPVTHESRVRDAGRLTWFGQLRGDYGDLPVEHPVLVDSVFEGNCAWRASMIRQLEIPSAFEKGDSFHYGLDRCLQARARGWKILYDHRAIAIHHSAPRSEAISPREDRIERAYIAGRNLTFIGRTRYRGIRRMAFWPWWFLVGERQSYGLLKGAYDLLVRPSGTWEALKASIRGRRDGLQLPVPKGIAP